MPAKKKSRVLKRAQPSRGWMLRPEDVVPIKRADGKWLLLGHQKESILPVDQAAVSREKEEAAMAARHPWHLLNPLDRALVAVTAVVERLKARGDATDGLYLRLIIRQAIRGLEGNPHAREWMTHAEDWPSFVPAGPEVGPLRKAWAKGFASREIGKDNADIPRKGKVDYVAGKPANLARHAFKHLDELRRRGPGPYLQKMAAAGDIPPEPEYMSAARNLPPLSKDTVEQWRALAVASLEHNMPDWNFWLQWLPGRLQTAKTKSQKKVDKGTKYGTGLVTGIDPRTAKNIISAALLEGLRALLEAA